MSEQKDHEHESQPRRNAMDLFVTRIWMHPLLTEKTKQKRDETLQVLRDKFGDINNIALIPQ